MQDRLDAIAARFGQYVTAELSVRLDPALGARMGALRSRPTRRPRSAGGRSRRCRRIREAGLVRLVVDGDMRLQIRPSGTEPKVKLYGEASTSTARCSTSSSPPSPPPPRPHP